MKNIKFRAWSTHHKRMFSPEEMAEDQLTLMPDGRGFVNVSGGSTKLSQFYPHLIPLQFTGLKDKEGKEIYEGDIVTLYINSQKSYSGCVIYLDGSFLVKYYGSSHPLHRPDSEDAAHFSEVFDWVTTYEEGAEVVGNIWESPELLPHKTQ